MKPAATRLVVRAAILAHFQQRRGRGRGRYLHNVAYHLIRIILGQREFDSLESLIAFCDDPDNLCPWLPMEADRIILSNGLVQGLRELPPDPDTVQQEPEAEKSHVANPMPRDPLETA
jgi:hypothetical protein